MKNNRLKKLLKATSLVIASSIPLLSSVSVFAASATMSLSSAGSVVKGSYITVSIRENSGAEPVNAAKATLSYPANLLSFVSVNSSSAFGVAASGSGGGGTVSVDRGALPAVSGSQTVATVTFKALTDSGTAAIAITSGSVLSANDSSELYAGGSGTNIALKAPAPVAEAPPADTIPPKITAVSAGTITPNTAIISWTTSEPATSEVNYGPNQSYGLAAADNNLVTDHKVTLGSPLIAPATLFHYIVKSADAAGNPASSPDATFTTKGAVLLITVVDQKGKTISGAKVELAGKDGITNQKGQVTLSGLPLGKLVGTVTYKGKQSVAATEITKIDPTGKAQNVTFQIRSYPSSLPIIIIPIILLLILIAFFTGWEERGGGSGTGLAAATRDLKKRFKSFLPLKGRGASAETLRPSPPPATSSQLAESRIIRPGAPPKT